jgi:hypothetical protein
MDKIVFLGLIILIGIGAQMYMHHKNIEVYKKIEAGEPVERRPGEIDVFNLEKTKKIENFSPYNEPENMVPYFDACNKVLRDYAIKNNLNPEDYIASNDRWFVSCVEKLKAAKKK